jgi:hypothetical protein
MTEPVRNGEGAVLRVSAAASNRTWRAITVVAVLLMLAASVLYRARYLDMAPLGPDRTAEYAAAVLVRSVNEWLANGISMDSLPVVVAVPEGIETGSPLYRHRELGYFPLPGLLLYATGYTEGRTSFAAAQSFGMLFHSGVIIALALLSFICVRTISTEKHAAAASICTATLATFLPGTMYFFFVTFFSDNPVITWFAWSLLLEFLRDAARLRGNMRLSRWASTVAAPVHFLGALTEWLFLPYLGLLLLKRLPERAVGESFLRSLVRQTLICGGPAALALLLYGAYITLLKGWAELFDRFVSHTGIALDPADMSHYVPVFWCGYMVETLGTAGLLLFLCTAVLTLVVLVLMILRRKTPVLPPRHFPAGWLLFLSVAPCLAHSLILRDHYIENAYTAYKFAVPLALAVGILPAYLLDFLCACRGERIVEGRRRRLRSVAVAASALLTALILFTAYAQREHALFAQLSDRFKSELEGTASLPREGDVLFSEEVETYSQMFQWTVYTGRTVWPVSFLEQIVCALRENRHPLVLIDPETPLVSIGLEWNLLPDISYEVPAVFTVGVLVAPGKSLPPALQSATPMQESQFARYRNYVFDGKNLLACP